eukprot:4962361-Prymnesium_polylepis.1
MRWTMVAMDGKPATARTRRPPRPRVPVRCSRWRPAYPVSSQPKKSCPTRTSEAMPLINAARDAAASCALCE